MAKRSQTPQLLSLIPEVAQKLFDRFPVARDDPFAYNELVNAVMESSGHEI